jgi:pyruvate formate lyase activating enzyme
MSASGIIFEVREFCLHDGPGIRTTVFFKGCPLRCAWCHNPEGLSHEPQLLVNAATCTHCGACRRVCPHPDRCTVCGACAAVCPQGCRRLCGRRVTAETLAVELLKNASFFQTYGGGITFSGGEPLAQIDFLEELAGRLRPLHLALETSGFAPPDVYRRAIQCVDCVFQDLKHPDPAEHRRYTGVDPQPIFNNLAWLKASGRPFVARIPLIPGVNDAPGTLARFAELLAGPSGLTGIEMLPYHLTAGAKYPLVGKTYAPPFDPNQPLAPDLAAFAARGLPCRVM